MVDGKQREAWAHTSAILAKLHNANCADKADLVTPDYFNPFVKKEPTKPEPLAAMKDMFPRQSGKRKKPDGPV